MHGEIVGNPYLSVVFFLKSELQCNIMSCNYILLLPVRKPHSSKTQHLIRKCLLNHALDLNRISVLQSVADMILESKRKILQSESSD